MDNDTRSYWSKEVINRLDIGNSTLRKWCLALEKEGYTFIRDEHKRRAFTNHDLNALRYLKDSLSNGHTMKNAIISVIDHYKKDRENEQETLNNPLAKNERIVSSDVLDQILDKLNKQESFNEQLTKKLDQQQEYIDERLKERDKNLVESMRLLQEDKKPWYKRLFDK